jgi:hypothetical protein
MKEKQDVLQGTLALGIERNGVRKLVWDLSWANWVTKSWPQFARLESRKPLPRTGFRNGCGGRFELTTFELCADKILARLCFSTTYVYVDRPISRVCSSIVCSQFVLDFFPVI